MSQVNVAGGIFHSTRVTRGIQTAREDRALGTGGDGAGIEREHVRRILNPMF